MDLDRTHPTTGRAWARLVAAWHGSAAQDDIDPAVGRVLAYAAQPAFTPAVAGLLVRSLSLTQLDSLWEETSARIARPAPPTARLGLTLVRAEVLDRLESERPEPHRSYKMIR